MRSVSAGSIWYLGAPILNQLQRAIRPQNSEIKIDRERERERAYVCGEGTRAEVVGIRRRWSQ